LKFPLINRTHYSIHRAFSKPAELAKAAKAAGYTHCGICDYGNISGSVEFFEACKKNGVVPVIGCDFGASRLFALNKAGWNELVKLVTSFSCDGFFNRESLDSPNLIVVNGSHHDCRYISKSDSDMYALTRALGEKIKVSDLNDCVEGFHFPSAAEITDSPVYQTIADRSSPYTILGAPRLPHFDSGGISEIAALKKLVEYGFKNKLGSIDPSMLKVYRDRVTYEMRVIELAELAGYFLIVADFVGKARKDQQLCSIGRGSAAGSLVSYLIGITLIDPIPYGLLFSRFFNAARAYPKHLSFDEYGFIDEFRDFETKMASPS
jgi:DNA polymerase III alpha subunit